MVRLAGKLQRERQIMSGTTFYFGHVTNKGDALWCVIRKTYEWEHNMPTKDHISKRQKASEIKMEIETESEQTYELILNVGDGNIEESERSEQFMIEAW